jgi:hypothetical protein
MARYAQLILASLMMVATPLFALEKAKPFSATAVQLTPQGAIQTRVYISDKAIRNEYEQNGHKMIEIIEPDANKRILLFPAEKVFVEQHAPAFPDRRVTNDDTPCAKLPGTLCRMLGKEEINGLETEKWEFSRVEKGRPVHTLHWIDSKRRLPVREFFADGTAIEMTLLEDEILNGRKAEKWRMQIMAANGQREQFLQWYDPEIKIVVREEHNDGYVRELRDIKVGKQSKNLFSVPKGYERRAQPPQAPQPGPPGTGAER